MTPMREAKGRAGHSFHSFLTSIRISYLLCFEFHHSDRTMKTVDVIQERFDRVSTGC